MSHTATPDEFFHAFARLDEQQKIGLTAAARHYAQGNTGFDGAQDLINELIFRVIEGKRNWSVDTQLMAFLMLGLRSVANGGRRLACNSIAHVSLDGFADGPDRRAHWQVDPRPSAEQELMASQDRAAAREAIEFARRALDGDRLALQVLDGMACDMSASDMRADFGVGKAELRAARGRVKSRLSTWTKLQACRIVQNLGMSSGVGELHDRQQTAAAQLVHAHRAFHDAYGPTRRK